MIKKLWDYVYEYLHTSSCNLDDILNLFSAVVFFPRIWDFSILNYLCVNITLIYFSHPMLVCLEWGVIFQLLKFPIFNYHSLMLILDLFGYYITYYYKSVIMLLDLNDIENKEKKNIKSIL